MEEIVNTEGEEGLQENLTRESLSSSDSPTGPDEDNSYISKMCRSLSIFEAPVTNNLQFVAAVDHFQKLITKLEANEILRPISIEISTLLRKFREIFSSQEKLIQKVKELTSELGIKQQEETGHGLLLQEKDKLIQSLKDDIDKVVKSSADTMKLRNEAVEELERCKKEFLEQQLKAAEEAEKEHVTEDDSYSAAKKQILKLRSEMAQEREVARAKFQELTKELASKKSEVLSLIEKFQDTNHLLVETEQNLLEVRNHLQLEEIKREKTERQLAEAENDINMKDNTINELRKELGSTRRQFESLESKSQQLAEKNRNLEKNNEMLTQSFEKLKQDFNLRGDKLQVLKSNQENLHVDFKNCEREIKHLNKELASSNREGLNLSKQVASLEHYKQQLEEKLQTVKGEKFSLEKNLNDTKKELHAAQKSVKKLQKEREVLTRKVVNCENINAHLTRDLKTKEESKTVLKQKLDTTNSELERANKRNTDLSTENVKLNQELQHLKVVTNELKKQISFCEINLNESRRQTSDVERKLDAEIYLHAQTKEDFIACKKSLDVSEEERKKLKNKISSEEIYIEQLTDNARIQESEKATLRKDKVKLESEIVSLKKMVEKEKSNALLIKVENIDKSKQINFLSKDISSTEKNLDSVRKDLERATNTINALQTTIVSKETEIKLLCQKLRIVEIANSRGAEAYNQRTDDIGFLTTELSEKSRIIACLQKKMSTFNQIKQELLQARQKLMKEELKVQAMEGDLKNPSNMHRWKVLEGEDPTRFQLIAKNQFLQKKLIKSSSAIAQKETALQECQKLADVLQTQLQKKKLGENMINDLLMYKSKYQIQKDKCDSLSAQVNMFFSQYSNCREEIKNLKEELGKLKKVDYLKKLNSR